MIKQIELGNIRLFREPNWQFDLPQLTVFCGTNSSGKSTVLKMLALLRENLVLNASHELLADSYLRLTGNLVDVGAYTDLVSDNDVFRDSLIAITILKSIPYEQMIALRNDPSEQADEDLESSGKRVPIEIELGLVFGLNEQQLLKVDSLANLRSAYSDLADYHNRSSSEQRTALRRVEEQFASLVGSTGELSGTELSDPAALATMQSAQVRLQEIGPQPNVDEQHIAVIRKLLAKAASIEISRSHPHLNKSMIKHMSIQARHHQEVLLNWETDALNPMLPEVLVTREIMNLVDIAGELDSIEGLGALRHLIQVQQLLSDVSKALRKVHYVGPIRAPAERFYLVSDVRFQRRPDPMGTTAPYILHSEQAYSRDVLAPTPGEAEPQKKPLIEALNEWLYYLRTGDSYKGDTSLEPEIDISVSRGVLAEIMLRSASGPDNYALIDSGFGYSQVLPILVNGLLAKRGSTLVVEQPELHLNPALQVRLAEFFVAMVRAGKQIVLETHSEHIVCERYTGTNC